MDRMSRKRCKPILLQSAIVEALSKVKALLRQAGARTREAPIEAVGKALEAVTPRDVRGFFEHCGYRLRARSL